MFGTERKERFPWPVKSPTISGFFLTQFVFFFKPSETNCLLYTRPSEEKLFEKVFPSLKCSKNKERVKTYCRSVGEIIDSNYTETSLYP